MGGHCGIASGHGSAGRLFGYGFRRLVVTDAIDRGGPNIDFHSVFAPFPLVEMGPLFVTPRLIFFNDEVFFKLQIVHIFNAGGHGAIGFAYGEGTANFGAAFIATALGQFAKGRLLFTALQTGFKKRVGVGIKPRRFGGVGRNKEHGSYNRCSQNEEKRTMVHILPHGLWSVNEYVCEYVCGYVHK